MEETEARMIVRDGVRATPVATTFEKRLVRKFSQVKAKFFIILCKTYFNAVLKLSLSAETDFYLTGSMGFSVDGPGRFQDFPPWAKTWLFKDFTCWPPPVPQPIFALATPTLTSCRFTCNETWKSKDGGLLITNYTMCHKFCKKLWLWILNGVVTNSLALNCFMRFFFAFRELVLIFHSFWGHAYT